MLRKSSFTAILTSFTALAVGLSMGCKPGTTTTTNTDSNPDSAKISAFVPEPIDSNAISYIGDTVEGMMRFKTKGNKFGFLSEKGDTAIPAKYDLAFDFLDGFAKVKKDGLTGFVNRTGTEVIPTMYVKVSNFSEGKAGVFVGEKWGFIDRKNTMVLPAIYDTVQAFGEGYAAVKDSGATYWSYIDAKGKTRIDQKLALEAAWPFSEGLAHCMKENLWGFIDKSGKVVVPFQYFNLGPMEGGSAPAQTGEHWVRIDKKGKCVKNCNGELDVTQPADQHLEDGHSHEGHDHEGHDHDH